MGPNKKFRETKSFFIFEGLAVLIGVLLAFGIEAWWDYAGEREKEENYLKAMRSELKNVTNDLHKRTEFLNSSRKHQQNILQIVVAGEEISIDSLNILLTNVSPFVPQSFQKAALHDIINAGGFNYIQDDSIRRSLAAYHQSLTKIEDVQAKITTYYSENLDAHSFQYFNLEDLLKNTAYEVPDLPFETDPSGFVKNKEYANMVIGLMWWERHLNWAFKKTLSNAEECLELINKELD
ncbi:MAG: hypothetical protein ACNS60_17910 [Candidatus Cyclobacteriaceae bacterium M2_1C_046]